MIRAWLARRRVAAVTAEYKRGFEFASAQLKSGRMTREELWALCEDQFNPTTFDAGMKGYLLLTEQPL